MNSKHLILGIILALSTSTAYAVTCSVEEADVSTYQKRLDDALDAVKVGKANLASLQNKDGITIFKLDEDIGEIAIKNQGLIKAKRIDIEAINRGARCISGVCRNKVIAIAETRRRYDRSINANNNQQTIIMFRKAIRVRYYATQEQRLQTELDAANKSVTDLTKSVTDAQARLTSCLVTCGK